MIIAVYQDEDSGRISLFEIEAAPGPIHITSAEGDTFERIGLAFEAESFEAAAAEWQDHIF